MEKSEGQEWIMEMWKAKENAMDEFKFNVETTVIGTAGLEVKTLIKE